MSFALARRALPLRPSVRAYTPHAPRYTAKNSYFGLSKNDIGYYAVLGATFGTMSGISALYFFGEVPRVRQDILVHIPVIGSYWERSVPPEDNPF